MTKRLDPTDLKILSQLQVDASRPLKDLADLVHLSSTPCWRRIQRLRANGVIRGEVALLDRSALHLSLVAFVMLRAPSHDAAWFQSLSALVATMPEVTEFHRLSGQTDYLLRVVVPDMPAYNRFYGRLTEQVDSIGVTSAFSLEELKRTTVLPLGHLV